MQRLILRLLEEKSGLFGQWAVLSADDSILSGGGPSPLAELTAHASGFPLGPYQLYVIVPGTNILLSKVELPAAQRRHIKKILPFVMEDRIADLAVDMHFVQAPAVRESEQACVAALRKSDLLRWLNALNAVGITAEAMMPESLLLPYTPGKISLLYDGKMAWLRTAPYLGIACEGEMLADMTALLAAELPEPIRCYITQAQVEEAGSLSQLLAHHFHKEPEIIIITSAFDVFCREYADAIKANSLFNILQGAFAPKRGLGRSRSLWQKTGAIAALWFILQMTVDAGQSFYFSSQERQLRAQEEIIYRQLFPDETKIVDPVSQMKSHLADAPGEAQGVLYMLQQLALHWPKDEASLHVASITYREEERAVTLGIEAKNVETMNMLVRQLKNDGITADIVSVTNSENGVKGQLSMHGGNK